MKILVSCILSVILVGCYTPKNWQLYPVELIASSASHPWTSESEREAGIQEFLRRGLISQDELENVRERRVVLGMSKGAVLLINGNPAKKNLTSAAHGMEQWVYGNRSYYYFENEELVDVQHF